MGNGANWGSSREYKEIKSFHDEAYKLIEEAIRAEENERPHDAIERYKYGIFTIDKALNIIITCPENPDQHWEETCNMVKKMKRTRAEVLTRINRITSAPSYVHQDPPPSYEDTMSTTSGGSNPRTYSELAEALDNLHVDTPQGQAEIVYTQDGVKMYFIAPNGTVQSTTDAMNLNIAMIETFDDTPASAFLQVGNWVYPLVAGVSPCYRTDYGAFIFPDVHSAVAGSSVGIIVPPEADTIVFELLENILHGIVTQSVVHDETRTRQPAGISGTISSGITSAAYYIAQGLVYGAQKAGDFMNYGTPKLIDNMAPATEATAVPSGVTKTLQIAETTTSTVAEVTAFVASKVGDATVRLGQYLAPHIQRQGTRLLTSGFNMDENEASNSMNGVLTVASGAVEAFSTIYGGLETSACILGSNLKNNSVKLVQHKYGGTAGTATSNTLNTFGNMYNIQRNTKFLSTKGFVKSTGKIVVKEIGSTYQGGSLDGPSTSHEEDGRNMYPRLNDIQDSKDKYLEKK